MSESCVIAAAGNTFNPCLLLLVEKGYRLHAEEDGDITHWNAAKDGNRFVGFSPPELLGIVVLWGNYREDWNRQKPNVLAEVLENMSD